MPDSVDSQVAALMEQFRRDLADIRVRHEAAIRELLEKARAQRLAELKGEIISTT